MSPAEIVEDKGLVVPAVEDKKKVEMVVVVVDMIQEDQPDLR